MTEKKNNSLNIQILGNNGDVEGTEVLDAAIANQETGHHILYQYEHMYRSNQRLGTAKAKDRAEVSGGGKKPWKQKGTGRARVGSNRSPLWTKGGVTFGPRPRNFGYALPQKLKNKALAAGLISKSKDGMLFLIEDFVVGSGKTKDCFAKLSKYRFKKPLVISGGYDQKTVRSIKNIQKAELFEGRDVSAHDILNSKECVLTKEGYKKLVERFSGLSRKGTES